MNELAKQQPTEIVRMDQPLTVAEVKQQVQVIQQVLDSVMKKGSHYDVIPGTHKNTLLKPGAEKILATFRIGTEVVIEDLGDGYDYRYRVTVKGFHIGTGNVIGYGVGEASTQEKKYAWREAICQEEWDDTPETKRRVHYVHPKNGRGFKDKTKHEKVLQVRQDPADLANTILKMAKKRALVDLCLTATACSDIFEQDLDEDHIREAVNQSNQQSAPPQQQYQQPQARPAAAPAPAQNNVPSDFQPAPNQNVQQGGRQSSSEKSEFISPKQKGFLGYRIKESAKSKEEIMDYINQTCGAQRLEDIPWRSFNTILDYVNGQAPSPQQGQYSNDPMFMPDPQPPEPNTEDQPFSC